MAFGRMSHRQGAQTPINSINVTPLVDVMLVLVVIFILAAPMLAASLRVQLPKAQAAVQPPAVSKVDALVVEVSPAGEIWIRGVPMDDAAAQQQLEDLGQRNPRAEVQLRADTSVPYGRVVQVMGWAHAAGLTRIGFVAAPETKSGSN
ncbi:MULTISPECIES: ExbD/TolR family protein [Comamonas]|jgi:biopolymer transport protein ExbD/biopolymer transport protein TolR|uniref:ExbD/TolR family protein n=1 Tax=Comamonas TaxID=283 RepID=UPI0012C326E5|nr:MULTISPECIES: biopolymer transporter ExbD [Comamonas]MDR3067297.1 biopolymer transporter ExbD [Comamonas sp.]MEB5966146.1 biopolymer transporter ExbD [Comamonas testosteroni]MPS96843.1 biopolymer transporter ExbD [Comamonas sp.]